jgi:phosphotriesterase-related protein
MNRIRTVLGDIDPETLGFTHCHEHIFIERDKSSEIDPSLLIDDYEKSLKELKRFRETGGNALVDAQPALAGRVAEWLLKASQDSGIHIIASTGFHKICFYYENSYLFSKTEQEITELYISEIKQGMLTSKQDGMQRSNARAGIIKTAVDSGGIFSDKLYEKLHQAAASAQLETGVPVMCHIDTGADAEEVVRFYTDAGVSAARIWIAHLDRADNDIGRHKAIASGGSYLEYDTIARPKYHDNQYECKLIMDMIAAGYENKLLLGLDSTRKRLESYGGKIGLPYLHEVFIPYLKSNGITEDEIRKLMYDNPKEALLIKK